MMVALEAREAGRSLEKQKSGMTISMFYTDRDRELCLVLSLDYWSAVRIGADES
jgi:hypothetical protein